VTWLTTPQATVAKQLPALKKEPIPQVSVSFMLQPFLVNQRELFELSPSLSPPLSV
jgi:hypothetical protein